LSVASAFATFANAVGINSGSTATCGSANSSALSATGDAADERAGANAASRG